MLVLTRQIGQSLIIGNEIKVTVFRNDKDSEFIQIGIEAPRDIPVHREEVYERIQDEDKNPL